MKVKNKDLKNLVLIVDDEIAMNELDREDAIDDLGLSSEQVLFAANYEEALKLWEKNDIVICYVDYKIPKNDQLFNYDDQNEAWGLSFISYLSSLNHNTSIVVYSAYVNQTYLQSQAEEFKNQVTAFYGKPHANDFRKQHYLEAVSSLEKREQNLFDYRTLDETTQVFIREKTQNIKILIANTLSNLMTIGQYMVDVRDTLEFGQFLNWLDSEFGEFFSRQSAYRFMMVYERFKTHDLESLSKIKISALYNLAQIPDGVIDQVMGEIIKDIQSGKPSISVKSSKQLLKQYKKQNKLDNSISETKIPEISENLTVDNKRQIVKVGSNANSLTKQQIVKHIPQPQRIWKLGKHYLMAVDPNSKEFIDQLSSKTISLCLSFPPVYNWQCPFDSKTQNIFYSQHDDLDNIELLKMVDQAISISTDRSDIIVVCYIPHPGILSVIHNLECQAIIAEPDRDKCLELLEFHNTTNVTSS